MLAPTGLHGAVGERGDEGVHFLLAVGGVGAVEDRLFFLLGQVGVAVHCGGVGGKG